MFDETTSVDHAAELAGRLWRHVAALLRRQRVIAIIMTSSSSIGRTPWFIAYDSKYDCVVVSIRGTWSVKDVVTDILAGSEIPSVLGRRTIAGGGGTAVWLRRGEGVHAPRGSDDRVTEIGHVFGGDGGVGGSGGTPDIAPIIPQRAAGEFERVDSSRGIRKGEDFCGVRRRFRRRRS